MIYAYLRVSTDEQADSGLGLEGQLAAIKAKIGEPVKTYTDAGFSGSDPKRPELLEALDSLRRGDVLAVAKRDRLARDTFLSLWIDKEVKKRGARIVSAAGEGTDSDDPASILMRTLVDAFATYERQIIGQRTSTALKALRAKGKKAGGTVPFGYDADIAGNLTENKSEQETIELIIALRARGYSLRQIAAELDNQSKKTKTNRGGWSAKVVRGILAA